MAKRRPKLVQFIPTGPEATFSCFPITPGLNYWRFIIADAYAGDRPEYRYTPPRKGCPFSVRELAVAAALKCNEGRGLVTVQEIVDGVCCFAAAFAANSMHVLCVRSTDPERARPVGVDEIRHMAKEAIEADRKRRETAKGKVG